MQAAGIGVVLVGELAARVQLGVDHLHGGDSQLGMDVHRHAPAVVADLAGAILLQSHVDFAGKAVGRLVDGVVHDLPDHMVKAPRAGGADVHAGTHAHRVQSLQDLYVICGISLSHFFLRRFQ